ncbi:MAG: hypothetical protein CVU97_02345 [Firmicutes bacterium HGW-Firmicutes-21]|nr:MAG: hypothetical protein CVU97_02345 [Firmicutes bacterium HGW-Firmicutes-21]
MKKILIYIIVFIIIALPFSGCGTGKNSDNVEDSILSEDLNSELIYDNTLLETAKQLLGADKLITDLFVGGLLTELVDVGEKTPYDPTPATGSEYEDFYVIEKLLSSTYSVSSGVVSEYLSFPRYGEKSISQVEGKTYFSYHYTEEFNGIHIDGIWLSDGRNENEKIISAGIYTVSMVFDGTVWLLEDSIYFRHLRGQSEPDSVIMFPTMNEGTAKRLAGNILAVEIFISDTKSSINDEEMVEFQQRTRDSFDLITERASSYGETLTIEYKQLFYKYNGNLSLSANEPYNFDFIIASTTYDYLDKYINDNINTEGYDGYIALLYIDKEGVSYSQPYSEGEADIFYAERCYIFNNTTELELTKNILALFGAESPTDEYLTGLMRSYYDNEIMLSDSLEDAVFGELTAYQLGLINKLDKQFFVFYKETEEEEISEEPKNNSNNNALIK